MGAGARNRTKQQKDCPCQDLADPVCLPRCCDSLSAGGGGALGTPSPPIRNCAASASSFSASAMRRRRQQRTQIWAQPGGRV